MKNNILTSNNQQLVKCVGIQTKASQPAALASGIQIEASGQPVQDGAQTLKSHSIQKEATQIVCVTLTSNAIKKRLEGDDHLPPHIVVFWPNSLPVISLCDLPKNLTAFFKNKSTWGNWKMGETKVEDSVHSENLPLLNWRVCHQYMYTPWRKTRCPLRSLSIP